MIDFELTTDRDVNVDTTGDWGTVSGRDNIEQQHVNAMYRAVEQAEIGLVNLDTVEDFRIAFQRELGELQYVDTYDIDVEQDPPRKLIVTVETNAVDDPVTEEVNV